MPDPELHLVRSAIGEHPLPSASASRSIFRSAEWLEFVADTQGAAPVVADVKRGTETVGQFVGAVTRRLGMRILGSPFAGWTTAYMGFDLAPEISRRSALCALARFAFRELHCIHIEVLDRFITLEDIEGTGWAHRLLHGYEIDLTQSEETLFARMTSACRRCIRKARREGVIVSASDDPDFADDYYAQLQSVFRRQGLAPTYGAERVRSLIKHLHPTGRLLLARAVNREGKCIATGIFPASNDKMYFWGGASWRASQHLRPNEALHWFAMRYWKERGVAAYDMGGGGAYKQKYGGSEIAVPWVRQSRNWTVAAMREMARRYYRVRQRLAGRRQSGADTVD